MKKISSPLPSLKNLKDVKNVIIRSNFEGKRVRIKDLAVVNEEFETLKSIRT